MPPSDQPWYLINNVDELDSPALVVFPEQVKQNIQLAINMVGDVGWLRPHVKTHKSSAVTELMKQAGITKFKCATIAEAEMLAQCKAKDILLAYQALGPKLKRFILLIQKYPDSKFSCLTDNKEAAAEQSIVFSTAGVTVDVFIDLNVGMNRSGIEPGKNAIDLYRYCHSVSGINVAGLHVYDGHIHDADYATRKQRSDACFHTVESMIASLVKDGFEVPVVIAGGSPTFPVHCGRKNVECSPGTFVYWDKSYSDLYPEQKFTAAALLVTRVVSLPTKETLCLDLGHKSVASENEITRRVYFLNAPELKAVSHSEEHMVVAARPEHDYRVGDILYGLPFHICPTVALYEKAYTVENGSITGSWANTARNRVITL